MPLWYMIQLFVVTICGAGNSAAHGIRFVFFSFVLPAVCGQCPSMAFFLCPDFVLSRYVAQTFLKWFWDCSRCTYFPGMLLRHFSNGSETVHVAPTFPVCCSDISRMVLRRFMLHLLSCCKVFEFLEKSRFLSKSHFYFLKESYLLRDMFLFRQDRKIAKSKC